MSLAYVSAVWSHAEHLIVNTAFRYNIIGWLRGTVAECRSLTGELSLSCARPAADG